MTGSIGSMADQLIKELGYSTVDRKIDRRNVIQRLDIERSEMLGILSQGGTLDANNFQISIRTTPQELPDIFYTSKQMPVNFDLDRKVFYSTMPTEYVMLMNNNGIRIVKPIQSNVGSGYFINQRLGAGVLYGQLESAQLGGQIGYEIEGQKLIYNNMPANTYTNLLVTYIPKLTGLREDEVMPCTGDFLSILMDRVKNAFLLQRQIPTNLTNDNQSE